MTERAPEPNVGTDLEPSESILTEQALTLKNGVEVGLGRQDPLIRIAEKLSNRYPHHLVLLQSGSFLHAYGKSAYFLHSIKKYKLRVVGTEKTASIRCGLPVSGHKRPLWHVFADYKVPYVVALGERSRYKLFVAHEAIEASLMDDIPTGIVQQLVEQLSQSDRLRTAAAIQLLLNPQQTTFRLKQVADAMYLDLHQDLQRFPVSHRYFMGRDIADCLARIMSNTYRYGNSPNKAELLRQLSAEIDWLKALLQTVHKLRLIDGKKFGLRVALAIELSNLIGGLIVKNQSNSPKNGVRG